jgi:hypothetical protein
LFKEGKAACTIQFFEEIFKAANTELKTNIFLIFSQKKPRESKRSLRSDSYSAPAKMKTRRGYCYLTLFSLIARKRFFLTRGIFHFIHRWRTEPIKRWEQVSFLFIDADSGMRHT